MTYKENLKIINQDFEETYEDWDFEETNEDWEDEIYDD